jgi:protein-disulfide isomerase
MKAVPRSLLLLAVALALPWAAAQVGRAPQALIDAALLAAVASDDGGVSALTPGGVAVRLEIRGGVVASVAGEVLLAPDAVADVARFLAAATGYFSAIEGPIAEFLAQDFTPIAGAGPIVVGVEGFHLTLDVAAGGAPFAMAFSLAYAQAPEADFPPARHAIGPADARYVIREFSDMQCPFCARFAEGVLPMIEAALLPRGDVRFEYHHMVLGGRFANSGLAAEASECVVDANADDDRAFFRYAEAIFARQAAWSALGDPAPYFVRLVGEVGLDDAGVATCLAERVHRERVETATAAAAALGVSGTPTVYVGPYLLRDFGNLDAYLDVIGRIDALHGGDATLP